MRLSRSLVVRILSLVKQSAFEYCYLCTFEEYQQLGRVKVMATFIDMQWSRELNICMYVTVLWRISLFEE